MGEWSVITLRPGKRRQQVTTKKLDDLGLSSYRPITEDASYSLFNYMFIKLAYNDLSTRHKVVELDGVRNIIGSVRGTELLEIKTEGDVPVLRSRFKFGEKVNYLGWHGTFLQGNGVIARIKIALLGRDFMLTVSEVLCDPVVSTVRSGSRNRRRHRRLGNQNSRARVIVT